MESMILVRCHLYVHVDDVSRWSLTWILPVVMISVKHRSCQVGQELWYLGALTGSCKGWGIFDCLFWLLMEEISMGLSEMVSILVAFSLLPRCSAHELFHVALTSGVSVWAAGSRAVVNHLFCNSVLPVSPSLGPQSRLQSAHDFTPASLFQMVRSRICVCVRARAPLCVFVYPGVRARPYLLQTLTLWFQTFFSATGFYGPLFRGFLKSSPH